MKHISLLTFLLPLGICALALNTHAQTVWQQMGAAQESQAYAAQRQARALENQADALQRQANVAVAKEMREEAREWAAEQAAAREAAAQAKAEKEKQEQAFYVAQGERNRKRDEAFVQDARSNPFYHTDSIPLANHYDDDATIRIYLHDSGYTDLSDAAIATMRTYMQSHGIHHVSELSQ